MANIPRIVLTGGPGGGKSTTLKWLESTMPELHLTPEAATAILQSGFPMPGIYRPWTPEWQKSFQIAVWGMQIGLDQIAEQDARLSGALAIVQDRSTIDPVAYFESIAAYEQHLDTKLPTELGKVSMGIFFPTYAGTPHFDNSTNEHRFEEQDTMIGINDKLMQAWKQHPNMYIIDTPKLQDRVIAAEELIRLHLKGEL